MVSNSIETIKRLREYSCPADFFKESLQSYVNETGEHFIQIRRTFHEILGYPAGIHAGRYRESILGVHLMSLVNALRDLEEEGRVERKGKGLWVWKEKNGGENE